MKGLVVFGDGAKSEHFAQQCHFYSSRVFLLLYTGSNNSYACVWVYEMYVQKPVTNNPLRSFSTIKPNCSYDSHVHRNQGYIHACIQDGDFEVYTHTVVHVHEETNLFVAIYNISTVLLL